jgi:putative tryptophan/tyrosine transport system substrate-binding protein
MRRREFIALLGGAAAWPLGARAQQPVMPVIGIIAYGEDIEGRFHAFQQGLKKAGYVDGQNVAVEYRGATQSDRRREIITDFVRNEVAVILASNDGPAQQARRATSTIPIVFVNTAIDPVKLGLVASLNRPGGNVTGVAFLAAELAAKRLDLLCQVVPSATTVAYLTGGPGWMSFEEEHNHLVAAAATLGRQLVVAESHSDDQLESAFVAIAEHGVDALIVASLPLFEDVEKLVGLAARYKIPAIYPGRGFALRGGLMSYSSNYTDNFLVAADLVVKILNGAKPADLPVRMSAKFDFVVNLKAAKRLGLEIPQHSVAFATEVIE